MARFDYLPAAQQAVLKALGGPDSLVGATLGARERLQDPAIGTRAKGGLLQIVRVTYNSRKESTVTVLSDYASMAETILRLKSL